MEQSRPRQEEPRTIDHSAVERLREDAAASPAPPWRVRRGRARR